MTDKLSNFSVQLPIAHLTLILCQDAPKYKGDMHHHERF